MQKNSFFKKVTLVEKVVGILFPDKFQGSKLPLNSKGFVLGRFKILIDQRLPPSKPKDDLNSHQMWPK